MKKLLVAAVIAGSFISFEAQAQERAGSAAPGALVLGPVARSLPGETGSPHRDPGFGVQRNRAP